MNKIFLKLNGTTTVPKGLGNVALTAQKFFGKDGVTAYCEPGAFEDYAKSLREPEVDQLDQAIECMNAGLRTTGTSTPRTDKGNRVYMYLNFVKINATIGLKVILEGGMKQLIADYQDGKIAIAFTLDELVEEALNA